MVVDLPRMTDALLSKAWCQNQDCAIGLQLRIKQAWLALHVTVPAVCVLCCRAVLTSKAFELYKQDVLGCSFLMV